MSRPKKIVEARECVICGAPALPERKTCSDVCRDELLSRLARSRPQKPRKHRTRAVKIPCLWCRKEIRFTPAHQRKYCSKECMVNYWRAHFKPLPPGTCEICGRPCRRHHPTCGRKECVSARLRNKVQRKCTEAMMAAARASEKCRKGPENTHAKEWRLCSPAGELFVFRNMNHFVLSHPELFIPEHLRILSNHNPYAATMLRLLRPGVVKHVESWQGWTWAD